MKPALLPGARRPLVLALLVAAGCGAAGAPHSAARLPAAPAITLVCWNIHHGRGADGKVDLDRIAAVLRACAADVIALQEVDVGVDRSGRRDLPAELGQRLGMRALFGHNLDYGGGQYGNAVLTRLPVLAWRNHRFTMLRPNEQRGALLVTLTAPFGPLTVLSTHLDWRADDVERLAHVGELIGLVRELPDAVVVAGDFNAEPASRVHTAATAAFADAWQAGEGAGASYPADAPRKRIDWILVRPGSLAVTAARVVDDREASDHRPISAVLRAAPAAR